MPWSPEQYHKFQSERAAPFLDLMGLVKRRPNLSVVDLGCGTGELTRKLADALPHSDVLGIDSSAQMLERALEFVRPGLRFEQQGIEQLCGGGPGQGTWDVVFSNAAIQWLDDHEALVPRLWSMVKPGGQLVVQMPSNHGHDTHRLIRELAAESPFVEALGGWSRGSPVLGVERYAEILYGCGGEDLVVFEKVYPHVLADADAMAEWTRGTALIPYLERLPEGLRDAFLATYRERLRARWPQTPVFYGFRRILFAATRVEG